MVPPGGPPLPDEVAQALRLHRVDHHVARLAVHLLRQRGAPGDDQLQPAAGPGRQPGAGQLDRHVGSVLQAAPPPPGDPPAQLGRAWPLSRLPPALSLTPAGRLEAGPADHLSLGQSLHHPGPPLQAGLSLPSPEERHPPHEAVHEAGPRQGQAQTQDSERRPRQTEEQNSEDDSLVWIYQLSLSSHSAIYWSNSSKEIRAVSSANYHPPVTAWSGVRPRELLVRAGLHEGQEEEDVRHGDTLRGPRPVAGAVCEPAGAEPPLLLPAGWPHLLCSQGVLVQKCEVITDCGTIKAKLCNISRSHYVSVLSLFHFTQSLPSLLSVLISTNCQYGALWGGVSNVVTSLIIFLHLTTAKHKRNQTSTSFLLKHFGCLECYNDIYFSY